jgi:hypothetical protein
VCCTDHIIFSTALISATTAAHLDLQVKMVKLILTLVIAAVVLPCMLAIDIDRQYDENMLREWFLEQLMEREQANVVNKKIATDVLPTIRTNLDIAMKEQANIMNENIATDVLPTLRTNLRAEDIAVVMQLISDLLLI